MLPFPVGLLALPAEAREEDEFVEDPESLRIGLLILMLEGGDFKRSVGGKSSTLFSLMLPVLVELPSNTIKGRFLPLSPLELVVNKRSKQKGHVLRGNTGKVYTLFHMSINNMTNFLDLVTCVQWSSSRVDLFSPLFSPTCYWGVLSVVVG